MLEGILQTFYHWKGFILNAYWYPIQLYVLSDVTYTVLLLDCNKPPSGFKFQEFVTPLDRLEGNIFFKWGKFDILVEMFAQFIISDKSI